MDAKPIKTRLPIASALLDALNRLAKVSGHRSATDVLSEAEVLKPSNAPDAEPTPDRNSRWYLY